MAKTTEELLAEVPLFQGLSKKHLQQVSNLATRLDLPAGKVIAREGDPGHEFIVILEGSIEIKKGGEVIATREAGSYVGEIALLEHRPRTATIETKTAVVADVIGQREFTTLLNDEPKIAEAIKAKSAERLQELGDSEG